MSEKSDVMKHLNTPALRVALPAAYADPAFRQCLLEAAGSLELMENFDRLYGCKVSRVATGSAIEQMVDAATGFRDEQLSRFAAFVHDCVYMRLPDPAIHALRVTGA